MNLSLTIGMAQIAPVWLDREATTKKMLAYVSDAADQHCDLVIFGEAYSIQLFKRRFTPITPDKVFPSSPAIWRPFVSLQKKERS
jgi:predicted amidohydrolase